MFLFPFIAGFPKCLPWPDTRTFQHLYRMDGPIASAAIVLSKDRLTSTTFSQPTTFHSISKTWPKLLLSSIFSLASFTRSESSFKDCGILWEVFSDKIWAQADFCHLLSSLFISCTVCTHTVEWFFQFLTACLDYSGFYDISSYPKFLLYGSVTVKLFSYGQGLCLSLLLKSCSPLHICANTQ